MSIFEAAMLVCFGAAWPVSIYKSWTSRAYAGKSVIFLYIVLFGYISGIIHKFIYNPDKLIYLYAINGTMVAIDIVLYYRNVRLAETKAV